MRWKKLLLLAPVLAFGGLGLSAFLTQPTSATLPKAGGTDGKPATVLPISQVVLFNSGVGYFGRSGEVEGDARVDLTFPETDINDLLKSMTLQDFDGGRVSSVSYDSREPVSRTLASFAVNLNNNPSLSQILSQARGEKVEVSMQPSAQTQPGSVSGTIVGMERTKLPAANNTTLECDVLNLLTADGLRAIKMPEVLRIKFTNPVLEAELKRALDVLALSHDTQKKAVSLNFTGEGKRKVKVGYVVEAPVWKTSYRLVLDKDDNPLLQGWAMVENPSDDDWSNVKMALVSGRPISFKMDLYNPLFVPRPTVEPEMFASLRPPTYSGGFGKDAIARGEGGAGALGGMGGPGGPPGMPSVAAAPAPMSGRGMAAKSAPAKPGRLSEAESMEVTMDRAQDKKFAQNLGREMAEKMDLSAMASAATASQLGDFFQYLIEHPVSLARQKSALLPIVNKPVEGSRVSIYNPNVQPKHPLLGLKFKNTSGSNLSQGPITVYEGSTYAGDARILDVQPKEERLLAYAIDLGTEVIPQNGPGSANITAIKAQKGIITTVRKLREERIYKISNRSTTDRTLLIEHPNRTNQGFKVVETAKPTEETAELLRFQTKVEAGKTAEFKVFEERDLAESIQLTNSPDDTIRYFINLKEVSPALKAKLADALKTKAKWDAVRRDLAQVQADVARITQDQDRIRKNLRETPKEAAVYDIYLKKLSEQEKEIDTLTTKQKTYMGEELTTRKAYEEFLMSISE
ncbi:MAG: DUF4139 domain-containing protein [Fimbriiglobus sp.]